MANEEFVIEGVLIKYNGSGGDVVIPDGVTRIGEFSFCDCSKLNSIHLGPGVKSVYMGAFAGCDSLISISVSDGNPTLHSAGNCIIETSSGKLVAGCKASVIPTDGSVLSIGDFSFSDCTGRTEITIPDGVISVGGWAFCGCSDLTSITIPADVMGIGDFALSGCTNLASINYKDTRAKWEAIEKGDDWNNRTGDYTVHCVDGDIQKS